MTRSRRSRPGGAARAGVAAVALLLVGCRGPLAVATALSDPARDRGWVSDPDLQSRATAAAEVMARVWGGEPSVLDGWTITFLDRYVARVGRTIVVGRTYRTSLFGGGDIEIWTGTSQACLEATDLAHEVGHVVIHDHHHRDHRWLDPVFWDRMAEALRAVAPPDDGPCRDALASGQGIWH